MTWRGSSIRSWKSGRSRSDQFKKMLEQVKTATEERAEMNNSEDEDDSGVDSYFSDVGL